MSSHSLDVDNFNTSGGAGAVADLMTEESEEESEDVENLQVFYL